LGLLAGAGPRSHQFCARIYYFGGRAKSREMIGIFYKQTGIDVCIH
jgi:hypothetical protein